MRRQVVMQCPSCGLVSVVFDGETVSWHEFKGGPRCTESMRQVWPAPTSVLEAAQSVVDTWQEGGSSAALAAAVMGLKRALDVQKEIVGDG